MFDVTQLKYDKDGLIPAIVQDYEDGAVLMMAFMNKLSVEKTLETGLCHYWSRSRQKLWLKGETSGHTQAVKEAYYDCDCGLPALQGRTENRRLPYREQELLLYEDRSGRHQERRRKKIQRVRRLFRERYHRQALRRHQGQEIKPRRRLVCQRPFREGQRRNFKEGGRGGGGGSYRFQERL